MFIVLNGYPGIGKLTIGRNLAEKLAGRLLDIHSVYNVAFALTDFRSPDFYYATGVIEDLADELISRLPVDVPLIFTTILTENAARGADDDMARFARRAGGRGPLRMVHLTCDLEENKRRIMSPDRAGMRKPRDPQMAQRNHDGAAVLSGGDLGHLLRLNVTRLSAEEAALDIACWISGDNSHTED